MNLKLAVHNGSSNNSSSTNSGKIGSDDISKDLITVKAKARDYIILIGVKDNSYD